MTRDWIRNEPSTRDDVLAGLTALGAAAVVGGVTYWLTRLVLAREPVALEPPDPPEGDRGEGER